MIGRPVPDIDRLTTVVKCPNCSKSYRLPSPSSHTNLKCTACGHTFPAPDDARGRQADDVAQPPQRQVQSSAEPSKSGDVVIRVPRLAILCVVGGVLIGMIIVAAGIAGLFLFENPAAQNDQLAIEHPVAPEAQNPVRAEPRDGAPAQPDGARVEAERRQEQDNSNAEAMSQAYIQQMFRAAEQQRQQDEQWRRFMNDLNRCNACGGSGSYSFVDAYGRLVSKPCPYCNGLGSDALIQENLRR